MTCVVKILQVERVVPYLIERRHIELRFASLELKNEENVTNDQDDVRTPAKARDGVFEVKFRG